MSLTNGSHLEGSSNTVGGRGYRLAQLLQSIAEKKQSSEKDDPNLKPIKSNIGRGGFLAQLSRQKELQALGGLQTLKSTTSLISERETISQSKPTQIDNKLEKLEITERPLISKKGECGTHINIMTNYVALKISPDKCVYEYMIVFKPDVDFIAFRFKLVNQHFGSRKGIKCYDGGTKLLLPEKLTSDKLVIDTRHPNDDTLLSITVTLIRKMTLGECGSLYNILFNNCAKVLKFARLGRQSYDYKQSHQVPQHKLEIWPGYVTSVREFEGGLLLCCDVKHRVLRSETAYDILTTISKLDSSNFRTVATRELLGQCVLTRYNNNLYRIDDIDWDLTPMSTFKLTSGEETTFVQYYKSQYNLDIKDLKQPLLLSREKKKVQEGSKKLICLVPEICHMTGLTDKMKNDFRMMKDIAKFTRITPAQRNYSFKKFLDNIRSNDHAQEMLREWGLTIADNPLDTNARILPVENIFMRNKHCVSVPANMSWGNELKKHGLLQSVDLKNWLLVHTQKDTLLANKFRQTIKRIGIGLGMDILEPKMVPLPNDRIETYIEGLRQNIRSETQCVVCLCPTARTDRYSAIKKFCCREFPVPSQVINCGTIARENKMIPVVQNVAIQINNKLGGASWTLNVPLKNCMVCGIDTFHQTGCYSVGAFVASLDADFTKWFSHTCMQEPKQELLDGLVYCFVTAMKKYLFLNHTLPDRIFIFRDGVGDGMLSFVQNHEVKQFIEAFQMVSNDYKPKFSFIVVSKRVNTKFYRIVDNQGTLENPCGGTVVDHTITRRDQYDFFVVPQHVSCGTTTPSHYIVLYDTSHLKPDHMQRLTYKFCHMYFNWSGTVRVPAPCLYAHKLAYLVGENIKGPASEVLEDKLFYL